jgi:hypothetical protein
MATARAKLYEPRLTVAVEGFDDRLPAVRFNSTFELNSIPQASVAIALGREFRSTAASPIHAIADVLGERRRKVSVHLSMEPALAGRDDGVAPALGIPAGEFVVFEGFTGAVGASISNGRAYYNIEVEHWLSDMNFSSVFSKTSHPANLLDYTFGAVSGGAGGAGCAGGGDAGGGPGAPRGLNWVGTTHAMPFFTSGNVESDLWLAALKPWFECLCSQDTFEAKDRGIVGRGKNDQALAALARMGAGDCYSPLALDLEVDADIGAAIAASASRMTQDPGQDAHITIWDTLVAKFGAEYIFAVVPLVSRALVVPFVPGYRRAFKVIPAAHQTQVEWTSVVNRKLRGMGVLASVEMATGPGLGPPGLADVGTGGFYSPDPDGDGQVMIVGGPDWLSLFAASKYVDESVGSDGGAIPDAMVPDVPRPDRGRDVPPRAAKIRDFLDRYCQALYALEMIRGRQAVAAGPVRFDVAPGSTVLVYPSGGIGDDDRLNAPFYATVLRVSTHLDAESAQAGTGFHLAHCRSERENSSDRTSVAKHPLYRNTFVGCGLL